MLTEIKSPVIDLLKVRSDTPGCESVVHLNHAGASLMPAQVLDTVVEHLRLEAQIGGYEAEARASEALDRTYASAAAFLGAEPDEIAILDSATRAWTMAFYAVPLRAGDRILTCVSEYASNYIAFLQVARRTGAIVEVIPNDDSGRISIDALRAAVDERAKLIAITHVPTNGGLVNPAAEVGTVARESGVLYLLDACQSVGQMPIDVMKIGCDMLSATGRKFLRGPRGTGLLYVRRGCLEQLEPPMLDLHAAEWVSRDEYRVRADARKFESWERNCAAQLGLGVALEYARVLGIESIWGRVRTLAGHMRERLEALPGVSLHDLGIEKCGIVSFSVQGAAPHETRSLLSRSNINVSLARKCDTRLDMEARGLDGFVRASVHYYNTEDEVEQLVRVIAHRR